MTGAATTKTQHLWTLSISDTARHVPISAMCNGKEVKSIQAEEPFLIFWQYPLNKCWFSFLLSWMSSTLTLKILNSHTILYLQLCLLFGPLGLKMFAWGPKSVRFYPYFIQPYILTNWLYLLSVESNEYEISFITNSKWYGTRANYFGVHGIHQNCACSWRYQQRWTCAIWARQSCWHQWSFHFSATTWISQSSSSLGLGSESLFSLNKIVSGL